MEVDLIASVRRLVMARLAAVGLVRAEAELALVLRLLCDRRLALLVSLLKGTALLMVWRRRWQWVVTTL